VGKARHLGLSVVASALLALGLTWPLGSVMASAFAGSRPLDSWLFIWNLWWVSHAITALHTNPFVTPLLYYPDGAPLYLHTLAFVPGLVAMPVSLLGGPIIAYNVSVLIALALAGCATYWLARRWTGPLGAAVAGLAFAAAPWLLHQLRIGHLNLASAGWYVLALLLLLRATDTGRWRDRLLGALGVIAAVLVDWQWAVFLLVAGGVIAVERLWTVRRDRPLLRRRLVDLGAIGLLVTVPLLPLLVAALRFSRSIPATEYEELQIERLKYSADLLAYVMPQLLHPLWGTHVNAWLVEHPLGAVTDGRVAVSLVALALALAALALRRPGVWLWLTIGLVGLVLSLGSTLHIGGVDTGLPLPYALLADVPPLSFSRTPARFAVLPTLAVAVLAGIGLEAIARRARRWPRPAARLLPAALVGLLAFELLPVPYPIEQVPSLELAGQVRAMAGSGAVLELPYGADDTQRMLYQTINAVKACDQLLKQG
jgi:hypothetical protein